MTGESTDKKTRRELAKMGLFGLPVILSMSATPAFASRGSGGDGDGDSDSDSDSDSGRGGGGKRRRRW